MTTWMPGDFAMYGDSVVEIDRAPFLEPIEATCLAPHADGTLERCGGARWHFASELRPITDPALNLRVELTRCERRRADAEREVSECAKMTEALRFALSAVSASAAEPARASEAP